MHLDVFSDKTFNRKLLKITIPVSLQNLMLAAVAACDAIMLGRVDQNAMSAVSLAGQIQFVQNIFFWAATGAASVLGAQYYGKGDEKTLVKIFGLCLKINLIVSILFFAGCECIPEVLMGIYTNEPVLISIGARYLRIAGWSYLITGMSQTCLTDLKVTGHVTAGAVISSTAVVGNIFLNAVLIFGLLGAPALGVEGAATATLLARIIEGTLAVLFLFRKDCIGIPLTVFFHRSGVIFKDFMKCALPILASGSLWGFGFSLYTAILGHLGTDAAAANSVSAVVRDLFCCLCNGIATGANIVLGNEFGAGNTEKGKRYGERIAVYSVLTGLVTCALILAITPLVLAFYRLTPQASTYLTQMMVIMAIYMIGRCINTILINGVFYSGGDILFDAVSLAVCMWGIAIPLSLLSAFVFRFPVPVVFACTCLDEVGKLPWVFSHFKKYRWVKNLTRKDTEQ